MPELVVNNKQASYKIARYLNKRLNNLTNLQYMYANKNSYELAQKLNNILINKQSRMITLGIKELYVNFPILNILHITKFWLNKHNNNNAIREQALHLLKVILKPNHFQYNRFFQPEKGIAMGSHIWSTMAEIYLHFF